MTDPELKPCPACGSKANRAFFGSRDILCSNYECEAAGPINDPDGAKRNARPKKRRKAKPQRRAKR